MPSKYIYRLYDDEGNTVFKGTIEEIGEFTGYAYPQTLYSYLNTKSKILRKYFIEKIGSVPRNKIVEMQEKKKNKHEIKLEYLEKHLKKFGNTVSRDNPKNYIDELKELGLDCTYRKAKDYSETYQVLNEYYIIEVKNGLQNI